MNLGDEGSRLVRNDSTNVTGAALKVAGVALVIGLLIAGGAIIVIRTLGLNADPGAQVGLTQGSGPKPLPTKALKVHGHHSPSVGMPTGTSGSSAHTKAPPANQPIQLSAAPTVAHAMQRISLTGTYPGEDNVTLQVQQQSGGAWTNFPVTVQVSNGTFETYIETGGTGLQLFRVYDPARHKSSNVVRLHIQ